MLAATVVSLSWMMVALAAPRLDLVMKPHATGNENSYLAVTMTLESPKAARPPNPDRFVTLTRMTPDPNLLPTTPYAGTHGRDCDDDTYDGDS